jgi:hypothetical protein
MAHCMIRSDSALLRHAQDFFLSDLVGLYSWGDVKIAPPEMRDPIAPNVDYRERRKQMDARSGLGRNIEQARICFKPWELLIYSSSERPPLGEVTLRNFDDGIALVSGPIDATTWNRIGELIRANLHQRKAS